MADLPRAFVCGMPIAHSRSPLIHRFWLKELALPGRYERIEVSIPDFPAFLRNLRREGYVGGNVTLPHKETAWSLVDRRDGAAEAIGAVNTLWFEKDTLVGGNTDARGFSANLDDQAPSWRMSKFALVLGAGGASRAVVHALCEAGVARIAIANRTLARAEELAAAFGATVSAHSLDELPDLVRHADFVVNTSSAGTKGEAGTPIDFSAMTDHAIVTDIVYVPLETPILAAARSRGLTTVDGLGMLLHQAVPGFERWFGTRPTVGPALRSHILADLGDPS